VTQQPVDDDPAHPRVAALQLFGVSGVGIAHAFRHMATDRLLLRATPGLRFVKLMGTGDARTFTPRDADVRLWALFTVWDNPADRDRFVADHSVVRSWVRRSDEMAQWNLRPLRWKGAWSGRHPFGEPRGVASDHHQWSGRVAVLTRARLKTAQIRSFLRAVPPVATEALHAAGLTYSVGIGEAPIGLQATFSVWESPQSVDTFAYRGDAHRSVIRRTATDGWYAEEMFARFAVESATGTVKGASMEVCATSETSRESNPGTSEAVAMSTREMI
jgi:hypothetical protein